ncbi:MAG: methyltransferase domain-containing protein [Halothiobacillaceae bacterium]
MPHSFGATQRLEAMAAWWQSIEGAALWRDESAALEPWLARCFGYHALHLCLQPLVQPQAETPSLGGLRIPHSFQLGPLAGDVRARFDALPLEAESVDLVVAQHVLELAPDPHMVLRELDRVLVPEGRVVLLSFNPLSYWGLRQLFNLSDKAPWFGARLGRKRLRDWLSLLGYEIEDELWVGHGGLSDAPASLAGLIKNWLPRSGSVFVVLARKRVSMPSPIRHRWRLMPSFGGVKADGAVVQTRPHLRGCVVAESDSNQGGVQGARN